VDFDRLMAGLRSRRCKSSQWSALWGKRAPTLRAALADCLTVATSLPLLPEVPSIDAAKA
jgi:hypothetical protein